MDIWLMMRQMMLKCFVRQVRETPITPSGTSNEPTEKNEKESPNSRHHPAYDSQGQQNNNKIKTAIYRV